ncbi:MAG: stalk domain-containing protein [Peptostreptococcaceae bacterium]|nr:stalk domain-containing protein [Peptostreptococcaceae bacterium]
MTKDDPGLPQGLTWEKSTKTLVMNGFTGDTLQATDAYGNLLNLRIEGDNNILQKNVMREGGIRIEGNLNIVGNGKIFLNEIGMRAENTKIEGVEVQFSSSDYISISFSELMLKNALFKATISNKSAGMLGSLISIGKLSVEGDSNVDIDILKHYYGSVIRCPKFILNTTGIVRIKANAAENEIYGILNDGGIGGRQGAVLKNGTLDINIVSSHLKSQVFKYEPVLEGQMRLVSGNWDEKGVRYTSVPVGADIERIEVDPPTQETYYEGDILDLDGMQVTIHKSDGSNEVVSPSDFASKGITIKPSATDMLKVSDNKIVVTHTPSGKTAETPITVKELHNITIVNDGGAEVQTLVDGKAGNKAKLGQTITVNVNNIPEDKILSEIKVVGGILDETINNGDTFPMPEADVTITVTLAEKPKYVVTVSSAGNGEATANPTEQYEGKEVVLTATPNQGFHFKEWAVTSGNVTIQDNKFTMGNQPVEIQAIFEKNAPNAYSVIVENDDNGTGVANPNSGVKDTEITLTSHPNQGYRFKEWQVVEGDVQITAEGKFMMPDSDVKIKAVFERIPFNITFKANGGTGSDQIRTVTPGDPFTLPANPFTPPANKVFDKWMIGNKTYAEGAQHTFTGDTDVLATWKDAPSNNGGDSSGGGGGGGFGGGGGGGTPSPAPKKQEEKKPATPQTATNTELGKDVVAKLQISNKEYKVVQDGKVVSKTMDTMPIIHKGRTMLPARMIAELLGIEVKFDDNTKTAKFTFTKEVDGKPQENVVELTLGKKMMKVNGKSQALSSELLNTNGRILLPMTDIQKALKELGLGIDVKWDHTTKEITLLEMK